MIMKTPIPGLNIRTYAYLMHQASIGRFAIHATAFHIKGQTVVIIGPSGIGKSTLREYLCEHHTGIIIHDDKPFLIAKNLKLYVQGHEHTSENEDRFDDRVYKVDKVYLLQYGQEPKLEPLTFEPLTLWTQFGIGIPDKTKPLELLLETLGETQITTAFTQKDKSILRLIENDILYQNTSH